MPDLNMFSVENSCTKRIIATIPKISANFCPLGHGGISKILLQDMPDRLAT
jgi:hypothetical protein